MVWVGFVDLGVRIRANQTEAILVLTIMSCTWARRTGESKRRYVVSKAKKG